MPPTQDYTKLLEEVRTHAIKMRTPVDNTRAKCVDGGYREDEAVGAMAIAGGHLGVSLALLGMGISPQEAFALVYDFVSKDGHPYCWHTDSNEGRSNIVGCGHCNLEISRSNDFGLDGKLVDELLKIVRFATADGTKNTECITLNREHEEKALLVATSSDFTVKPWNEAENIQYFIYDKIRHADFLHALAEYVGLSYDNLWAESARHTNITLGLLGSSKGKPMVMVNVDDETPLVEYLGDVWVLE